MKKFFLLAAVAGLTATPAVAATGVAMLLIKPLLILRLPHLQPQKLPVHGQPQTSAH